jgi:site-specific recombinase XerD
VRAKGKQLWLLPRTLQAYLGHRNIQHTVRYTELSPTRFKNLWRD